jgi:hypothetical protein
MCTDHANYCALSSRLGSTGCKGNKIQTIQAVQTIFYSIYTIVLRERGHWEDQDVDGRIILRWIFRKLEGVVGTGLSWLLIGTGGGHLWVR